MTLCIVGMHRSATSMMTRILSLCGVYLGDPREMIPAQAENPEGFWEHARFHSINERVLATFHGGWDCIPDFPEGWVSDPRLEELRLEAERLVEEFEGRDSWGWKDPRTSITLPFWQTIIPDLKIVALVRNPLDVAASLATRGHASVGFGLALWTAYSEQVNQNVTGAAVLYTHQSVYFKDPLPELIRVCGFLGLSPSDAQLEEAINTIQIRLRHSNSTMAELFQPGISPQTLLRYVSDCARCGVNYHQSLMSEIEGITMRDRALHGQIGELRNELAHTKLELYYSSTASAEAQRNLDATREAHRAEMLLLQDTYEAELEKLKSAVQVAERREREMQRATLDHQRDIGELDERYAIREREMIARYERALDDVRSSRSYQLGNRIVRLLRPGAPKQIKS